MKGIDGNRNPFFPRQKNINPFEDKKKYENKLNQPKSKDKYFNLKDKYTPLKKHTMLNYPTYPKKLAPSSESNLEASKLNDKINQLKNNINSGQYKINYEQLAERMLNRV